MLLCLKKKKRVGALDKRTRNQKIFNPKGGGLLISPFFTMNDFEIREKCVPAKHIVTYRLQGETDALQAEVRAFDRNDALNAMRQMLQKELPNNKLVWTSTPWYYNPELTVYQSDAVLGRYVDFHVEEVPLKEHTFYSVEYSVWGADRTSEAWFDDLEEAKKFANQDYRGDVKTHHCSDPTTIRYYAMLAGVDPYLKNGDAMQKNKKRERGNDER